jgi:hypothetical protein
LDETVDVTLVDFDSTINDGHFTPNNHHGSSRATHNRFWPPADST